MLVVIRGNSGSGKSTVARLVQERLSWPTAPLEHDCFRRTIYRDHDHGGATAHADLLEAAAVHALERGHHVIVDGIFNAAKFGDHLQRIAAASDDARFYSFDLSFEETVARHNTRAKHAEFTVDDMREWYHGWQPLPFVQERHIGADETVEQIGSSPGGSGRASAASVVVVTARSPTEIGTACSTRHDVQEN